MITREEAVDSIKLSEDQLRVAVMDNIDAYLVMTGATEEQRDAVDAFVKKPVMQAATRLKYLSQNLSDDAD